ncbi:hypothetical protein NHX12_013188 [Muraenolepis orangiensis]|uniref:Uncharacterized protein n=1 Tax=Muraenolepis orangiensis TaxID=630683 RepID=A0A9Q0I7U7_9TELE|nr:hypothetical protein NHX12_013188 [Muraenolepis orangiensis]
MKSAALWGLLALLLCELSLGTRGHVLGRHYSTGDLAQLKSLLERFEETLPEGAPEDDILVEDEEYDGADQEPDRAPVPERRQGGPAVGYGRTASQMARSRLQDLLTATRSRTSGCFGSRMDRIGSNSNLGCNSGRGSGRNCPKKE